MKDLKNLIFSKNTLIELTTIFILFILINKYCFLLLISLLFLLLYKSNKTSNIPLPKEIEKFRMKAFLVSPKPISDELKDKFIFEEKVNLPQIKSDNDILIKIYSQALNEADYFFIMSQMPFIRWFKMSFYGVGMDFSGKIVQLGKNVTKYKIGDEIFGFSTLGVLQEYTLTKENLITKKPNLFSFNEVVCIPCYLSIQIAKYLNFEKVYGVCSSRNKSLAESFGVDGVLCYDKENYINECKEKFDLIFDNVSSPEAFQYDKYKVLLKEDIGEYVDVNGTVKQKMLGALQSLIGKKIQIEPKHFHLNFGSQNSKYLEIAVKMLEEKKLKLFFEPHIFDKKEIISCYEVIKSRRTRGKLLIEINKDN